MDELIKIDENQLILLNHRNEHGEELPKPFEQEIYLLTTYISRPDSLEEMNELIKSLEENEQFQLYRDLKNENDKYAVVAQRKDGTILGRIPRHDNKIPARLMDAGKLLYARIVSKAESYAGEPVSMDIDIFLKE